MQIINRVEPFTPLTLAAQKPPPQAENTTYISILPQRLYFSLNFCSTKWGFPRFRVGVSALQPDLFLIIVQVFTMEPFAKAFRPKRPIAKKSRSLFSGIYGLRSLTRLVFQPSIR